MKGMKEREKKDLKKVWVETHTLGERHGLVIIPLKVLV